MDFNQYNDMIYYAKKSGVAYLFKDKSNVLDTLIEYSEYMQNPYTWRRAHLEKMWIKNERPYYKVYPAIVPMLINLKLDVPCHFLKHTPVEPIELKLPTKDPHGLFSWRDLKTGEEQRIRGVLMGFQEMPTHVGSDKLTEGLVICFDPGELDDDGAPIMSLKFFPLNGDVTISEANRLLPADESWNEGLRVPDEIVTNLVKLCTCICLIGSDPEIIRPEILKKDESRFQQASEAEREAMFAMAKRRGKHGWLIGYDMEVSPHYRSAHLARVWTGEGRKVPRIVMRKGTIVHREKLTTLPSGYSEDQ